MCKKPIYSYIMAINRILFLFYRDLRLEDNRGLREALAGCDEVWTAALPAEYGLRPAERDNLNRRCFRHNSLSQLGRRISDNGGKLMNAGGDPEAFLKALLADFAVRAVYMNALYDAGGRELIKTIRDVCVSAGAVFETFHEGVLSEPGTVLNGSGLPYRVFTPFYKKSRMADFQVFPAGDLSKLSSPRVGGTDGFTSRPAECGGPLKGGREEGLSLIGRIRKCDSYSLMRDIPAVSATSLLSAHLNNGTVSPAEVLTGVSGMRDEEIFRKELFWRDFFIHVAFHFPRVFTGPFRSAYETLKWDDSPALFELWAKGETGYPFVDAGMRQLALTGFMHNRVRMAAASFLVKDLHMDWRRGEEYFARHLTDYEPCVNNGNWQWSASTGCDSVPYFRVMNPERQRKRYDPEGVYIRRWLLNGGEGVEPVVNHAAERMETLRRYKKAGDVI